MKITLLGPLPPYKGGISQYNYLLLKHLSKKHDVKTISWKKRFPQFLYPGKEQVEKGKEGIIKKDKKFILSFFNPLTWIKTGNQIKKHKSELLIFHWVTPFLSHVFFPILLFTKLFTKTKTIAICHNVIPHEKRFIDSILTKLCFSKFDYFITHSESDTRRLKSFKNNAHIIQGFLPTYESITEYRIDKDTKSKLNLKEKTILFFGYVRGYKGLKYLIKAMPSILKKIDCNLLIVGEFWDDKKSYLDLIKRLNIKNNVKIIDNYVPDEDIKNYFDVSNVVVMPYIGNTQSAIAQLAFSFDKPIITTNLGGLDDVAIHNKNCLIIPLKNPEATAKAVISFYQEKKSNEFIKNIKETKEKFSWEKYISLFQKAN